VAKKEKKFMPRRVSRPLGEKKGKKRSTRGNGKGKNRKEFVGPSYKLEAVRWKFRKIARCPKRKLDNLRLTHLFYPGTKGV